jgi:hypothetical protein
MIEDTLAALRARFPGAFGTEPPGLDHEDLPFSAIAFLKELSLT